jgi:hypothetical protein
MTSKQSLASSYFARITYREVKAAHLEDILKANIGQKTFAPIGIFFSKAAGSHPGSSNHKLIERGFDTTKWRDNILLRSKSIAR